VTALPINCTARLGSAEASQDSRLAEGSSALTTLHAGDDLSGAGPGQKWPQVAGGGRELERLPDPHRLQDVVPPNSCRHPSNGGFYGLGFSPLNPSHLGSCGALLTPRTLSPFSVRALGMPLLPALLGEGVGHASVAVIAKGGGFVEPS
jgi:hypothetical protein